MAVLMLYGNPTAYGKQAKVLTVHSWSTSGRLLASGSDDHRINIHSYHPDSSTSQFSLTTSILTHHRTNIFSVKFMPYSNDRTIVSATDDVRIFDIEHSGHSALGSSSRSSSRRTIGMAMDGLTLTEGDTNAKAFRCHTNTVKRIVTEDNPFYFLTCSKDGDVRQWDVRQPASNYPRGRDIMAPRWAQDADASDNVPPPLISYSRYGLDLNTVSCSPSQPHYIALGGAHLHCFLHDRRMLGRDKNHERGSRLPSPTNMNEGDEALLGKATQCVKKFAPHGKQRMRRNDGGHITACKISDAYPNELLVSWSQDHIYSFDMLRAPDASEKIKPVKVSNDSRTVSRVKEHDRKRKRTKSGPSTQDGSQRGGSRQRTESADEDIALRVTYGNGQREDIRIDMPAENLRMEELRSTKHFRIAKTTITIAKRIFDLGDYGENTLKLALTSIVGLAYSILEDMDDIARTWGYPVDPDAVDVTVQNRLRDARATSRRFVQAAGTLSRALGGQLLTGANSDAHIARYFASIQPAPREREMPRQEQFALDFLKAILLWLDSGPSAVVEGFSSRSSNERNPIPQDSGIDAIDECLIPYLLELASDMPIMNVDANKFEIDERRVLISSEKLAVNAFARAVKLPFVDLIGGEAVMSTQRGEDPVLDRETSKRRWAYQIGRGLLFKIAKGITFAFVDRAFGGRGIADEDVKKDERFLREQHEDIDTLGENPDEDEDVRRVGSASTENELGDSASSSEPSDSTLNLQATIDEADQDENEAEQDDDDSDDHEEDNDDDQAEEADSEDEDEESDSDEEDEDGLRRTRSGRMLWRSDFGRSHFRREKVERDVPCVPHTRVFTGHCNVKTVKDVNYFGLQDEYVVSGSDSGHVFIWDRKTAQLVNILEGDGEVVNVVQGKPPFSSDADSETDEW